MKIAHVRMASTGVIGLVATAFAGAVRADGPQPKPGPAATATATVTATVPAPAMPADLARRVQEITDVVLEHHIRPPARQQMILSGIRMLDRAAGVPEPVGLSQHVSAIATPEQLAALLKDVWPKTTAGPFSADRLEEVLLEGLLSDVPGRADLMTDKERKVTEQFAGNRYVGLHIALGTDDKEKRPTMHDVFPGGPADRAGVKKGDRLEEIDGVDTKGKELREVVDRLRGDEGTAVTIKVRQPGETQSRTMTVTRGTLPHATIEGIRKHASGEWKHRLDVPDPIGYIKVTDISASTPHELRKLARQMENEGIRALAIDLRDPRSGNSTTHFAVLLADALLDGGSIGRVRTVRGETTYQADSEALFRGWPIAVLVDQGTSGTAEWLAAALQDNHRAVIVGWPTRGAHRIIRSAGGLPMENALADEAGVRSTVPVGDGRWAVSLVTGTLERGDGRPLVDRDDPVLGDSPGWTPPRGGVQPDHRLPAINPRIAEGRMPVDKPEPPRKSSDRGYAVVKPEETPRLSPVDPAVQAAVTVLRQAMEKS